MLTLYAFLLLLGALQPHYGGDKCESAAQAVAARSAVLCEANHCRLSKPSRPTWIH